MRLGVERPATLVDVARLPLSKIEPTAEGISNRRDGEEQRRGVASGDPRRMAVLSEALLSGASPQIRNMASVGGNLLQRTRCPYFRDQSHVQCNKRVPGSGCGAMDGWSRMHAVLGASDKCIAVNPSDMNVALLALDAVVHVRGRSGARQIPIAELHTLPGDHPEIESTLAHGGLSRTSSCRSRRSRRRRAT